MFPKFDFNKDYSPTTPLQQAEMCQNWQRDLNRSRNVTDVYFLSGTSPKKIRWGLKIGGGFLLNMVVVLRLFNRGLFCEG